MLTRPLATVAVLALLGSLTACGSEDDSTATDDPTTTASSEGGSGSFEPAPEGECAYPSDGNPAVDGVEPPSPDPTVDGEVEVSIATSAGQIDATLDAATTPCTVNSFVSLADQGYFDGTECHRLTIAPSTIFVLQCGDPTATGTGGPGYTIPDELSGEETYPAGTLAMAKTPYPDSGGSQFFMVYEDTPLPPNYTVFGTVDPEGVDVLRAIAEKGTANGGPDGPPTETVELETVTAG
ncbi:peptidylprolyl isomerase [uncultured Nocardioides sp.]|jgi:peptidyl-prolyl cis-trans isomerase B (cyclophilin B)|uniref:peptidylprolyl isomerase n=1 Tax=uncultured Nocardioides sp. TaxID=198441 RepID=UPI000C381787|nr:peptidylprolyl isomerase [uncultured Nocardioides sp.]MAO79992.1 peptidylprolyl isomerase [Nocardioides sp.]